jgi:cell division protease FtsH
VKQSHKTLLLWVLLILMFLAIWQFLQNGDNKSRPVPFSDFLSQVHAKPDQPRVEKVTISNHEYRFDVNDPNSKTKRLNQITIGPEANDALTKDLVDNGVNVTFEKEEPNPFWSSALMTVLPMVFLLVMFYLFMRQLQAGGGKAMSFGKSRARLLNESQNKVTFADVAGIDEAKDEVEEIIAFL